VTDRQRKPPVLFRRLVRDRVPEKLDQSEENSICRVLGDEERVEAYGNKLLEEAYELYREWKRRNAGGILDESADALEIILAILGSHDLGLEELLERWRQKNETEGGYSKGIFVESGGQGFPEWAIEGAPALILTRLRRDSLVEKLRSEFNKSKDAWIVSAFFSPGRTNLLLDDFRRFIELGGNLSVILSTMGNFVRPDHFTHLQSFVPGIQLRVFHPPGIPYEESPPNFHPKAFLFRHQDGTGAMIIGSSNLTEGGLRANIEWNYYTSLEVNLPYDGPSPFNTAIEEFRRCWEEDCTEVTKDFLEGYRRRWALTRKAVPAIDQEAWKGLDRPRAEIEPNEAQTEGLESLRVARNQGMKKAVVIAATGVGKTYLAALDYGQSGMRNILYIAHRENILRKSRESFREVLGDPRFGSIMGGGNPYPPGRSAVFAMIQTLARKTNLRLFSPEHFDYVVVDEFHHGMARSYLKVLEHLKPKFLLGLTATPERMDGRDVLALCDYNVAQELRLLAAVEKGLLVPFQYYAVYDETDYEQIAWRGTRYDEEELDRALESDTRTAIVANNLRKFLPSSGKIKALAFCSSLAHARFTARKLTHDHGIEALPLLADSTEEERAAAIRRLQDERDGLLVIAAVDIFNEGVDIPPLTHVLFLRPTQSFTIFLQQLGRGLRKSPGKDFLVVIDFVGNFRKAHVAPLALSGYTSLDEYLVDRLAGLMVPFVESRLPDGCYVNADLAVQRIWDLEIKRILDRGISIQERLKELYQEIKEDLGGESPKLVDFLANSRDVDPYAFIKVFGGWLRAKLDSWVKTPLDFAENH